MFEHIHFQEISFSTPFRKENSERFYQELAVGSHSPTYDLQKQVAPFRSFYDACDSPVDYELQGNGRVLFPVPQSEYAKDHLLCLQVFGVMNASEHFFTRRKDYDSWLLLFTYDGEGLLEYDGKTFLLKAGDGCFIDCRKSHYYRTNGQHWKLSTLHFQGPHCAWIYEQFNRQDSVCFHDPTYSPDAPGDYQHLLENVLLASQNASPIRELEVSVALENLLLFLLRQSLSQSAAAAEDYITYLIRYMENNYTRPLSLDDLSSFSGISKYHLSREFKKRTGFSPGDYLIELRMNRARFLLANTALTVEAVSRASGFSSYPNFLKLFKKRAGTTPHRYRSRSVIP